MTSQRECSWELSHVEELAGCFSLRSYKTLISASSDPAGPSRFYLVSFITRIITSTSISLSTLRIIVNYKPELILIVSPPRTLNSDFIFSAPVACGWEKRI